MIFAIVFSVMIVATTAAYVLYSLADWIQTKAQILRHNHSGAFKKPEERS